MSNNFKKFIKTDDSGARKKERIRQEKKKLRQETKEYFEKKKQEARDMRAQGGVRATKPGEQRGGYSKGADDKRSSYGKGSDDRRGGYAKGADDKRGGYGKGSDERRGSYNKNAGDKRGGHSKTSDDRRSGDNKYEQKPSTTRGAYKAGDKKDFSKKPFQSTEGSARPAQARPAAAKTAYAKPAPGKPTLTRPASKSSKPVIATKPADTEKSDNKQSFGGQMPLNKFIAHAGICSRRDAAEMVKQGKVQVNGEKITEPGHKVSDKDDIKFNGKKIGLRRNLVYILVNKPKDFITTTEDPQGRKTVLDLIKHATEERVYPIGRLDRNTTGVLLLTNDGELAQKLSHPSYEVRKIYEVKLDKPLVKKDMEAILQGVTLEDGFVSPDALAYADAKDKSVIGIEIHSGRNRIVRRIFEHMGYDVRNLDRVMYANLTKKNVDRGKWRFLNDKEVRLLKFLNKSYTKKK